MKVLTTRQSQSTATAVDENIPDLGTMPEWVDRAIPWISSFLIHAGVLLLFLFAWQVVRTAVAQKPQPIIIPLGFTHPTFSLLASSSPHPGIHNNPFRSARQETEKILSKAWHANVTPTRVSSLISQAHHTLPFIAVGRQGGSSGGTLAAFGVPGGGVGDFKSTFLRTGVSGGNATRIVYILDHEGSMLENFTFLKRHLRRSIDRLQPVQSLAVIVFRKSYKILGPHHLIPATDHNKAYLLRQFRSVAPAGAAKYRFRYFARPFRAAFRMKPQVIYFLTSGAFDPRLIAYIHSLNKNKAVHIFTYAFALQDPTSVKNLQAIARENGGQYEYISRRQAGE